jgi:hypothetical protein
MARKPKRINRRVWLVRSIRDRESGAEYTYKIWLSDTHAGVILSGGAWDSPRDHIIRWFTEWATKQLDSDYVSYFDSVNGAISVEEITREDS